MRRWETRARKVKGIFSLPGYRKSDASKGLVTEGLVAEGLVGLVAEGLKSLFYRWLGGFREEYELF